MNILITGSSGQIGTNVGLALLSDGHSVLGVDCRANTWTDKIETLATNLVDADLDVLLGDRTFDVVLHLAANAKVYELVEHPERALDNLSTVFRPKSKTP